MPAEDEAMTVLEVNCSTGEKLVRPMTEAELTQWESDRLAYEAAEAERLAEEEAKAAAKASAIAKLAALGLTEDEAAALVGQ